MSVWKWLITSRYNDNAEWPKIPGEIALQTRHADDASKDLEVGAYANRTDVDVEVTPYVNPYEGRTIGQLIVDTSKIGEMANWWDNLTRHP